jgi:hypothetical protein
MGSYGSVIVIERGVGSTRQGWYLVWPRSKRVVRIGDDYGRHPSKQAAEDTLWSLQRFGRVELEKSNG